MTDSEETGDEAVEAAVKEVEEATEESAGDEAAEELPEAEAAEDVAEEAEESQAPTEERRQGERIKVPIKRTVLATVEDEAYGSVKNHLYIVDLSQGGIRINLDRNVEPESELRFSFSMNSFGHGLEGDFEAKCRVVWSRPLAGGTCILGMEFLELAEEQKQFVSNLLDHWREKEGYDFVPLPGPVDAKVRLDEEEPWQPMVGVRAISRVGFQYHSKMEVSMGQTVYTRILLEPGTVSAKATVVWCKPMPNGAFDIGCRFEGLSSGKCSYIDLHLKRCRHRPIV